MQFPILYGKDQKGADRYWSIEVEDNIVITSYGMVGTDKPQTNTREFQDSKQVSAESRAFLHAKNKWIDKMKQKEYLPYDDDLDDFFNDYGDDLDLTRLYKSENETKSGVVYNDLPLPNLANLLKKDISYMIENPDNDVLNFKKGYRISRKLDGERCIFTMHEQEDGEYELVMSTRRRSIIKFLDHLREGMLPIMEMVAEYGFAIEGELYKHGTNFQDIMRRVKRAKTRHEDESQIEFWIFDIIDDGSSSFEERYKTLKEIVRHKGNDSIKLVEQRRVKCNKDIVRFHKESVSLGYEGSILRDCTASYRQNSRSNDILKIKDDLDTEAVIVDMYKSSGNQEGVAMCVVQEPYGRDILEYNIGIKGFDLEEKRYMYKNRKKYIGKKVKVKYLSRNDTGVPQHSIIKGFIDKI